MCLNTGTPKNINFSFETNGKLMALGVPILKHIRVVILTAFLHQSTTPTVFEGSFSNFVNMLEV